MMDNNAIKERAESFAEFMYKSMKKDSKFKDMNYGEFMLALDNIYAEIASMVYNDWKKNVNLDG